MISAASSIADIDQAANDSEVIADGKNPLELEQRMNELANKIAVVTGASKVPRTVLLRLWW
jgi:hypothetical protein